MLGLMSVGMNLVYGTTGLQSFSHGEQVTLGGLMAYVGTQMLHMPLIASAIFAIVIGALTGFIQNEIVWGPLRRRHVGTMQQMIVTIGLSMALQYTFQFFFGGDIKGIVKSVPDSFQLGPITTDMPTLVSALIAICVIVGVTLFLYKTDYLKLKNLTIGYTLPERLTRKVGIGSLRIFLTGDNLFTITDYPGIDPEFTDNMNYYANLRQYTIGLNIKF